jgi:hypothetical protein
MSHKRVVIGSVRMRADGLGRRVSLPPEKRDGDGARSAGHIAGGFAETS